MSEADFATETEKGIKSIISNAHVSFIESHLTSAGFPDMDIFAYIKEGRSVKLELKFSLGRKLPHMRASQVKWFRKRDRAGGEDAMIFAKVMIDDAWNYLLISGKYAKELARAKTLKEWRSFAMYHWKVNMNWEEFINLIFLEQ